jgi:hypothetical protein
MSLEAPTRFAAVLREFRQSARQDLESTRMNVRAAVEWVQRDRKAYWTRHLRRSEQRVQEAKINLQSCLTFRRVGEQRPSCIEEKRYLERCQRRLTLCRERLEAVAHFSRVVDRAAFEFQGGITELARWLETDADRAAAELDRLLRALEEYLRVASPEPTLTDPPDTKTDGEQ